MRVPARWRSVLFTRGRPRSPQLNPQTLIIEPDHDGKGMRALSLDGAINFRDLGGYRTADGRHVKWGRVFRSGALSGLSDGDLETLKQIGLRQVFDLRLADEIALAPDRLPQGAEYVPLSVKTESSELRRLLALLLYFHRLDTLVLASYTRVMIERNAPLIGQLFRRLADEQGKPAVIHCTAGKDRTGMVAALLLLALGVPEATVIADYSLTNHAYDTIYQIVAEQSRSLARFGLTVDDMQPLLLANPETLKAALHYLHEHYGSVENYLRHRAGMDGETLARLRESLLE